MIELDTDWVALYRDHLNDPRMYDGPLWDLPDAWKYSPLTVALARGHALTRVHVLNPLERVLRSRRRATTTNSSK